MRGAAHIPFSDILLTLSLGAMPRVWKDSAIIQKLKAWMGSKETSDRCCLFPASLKSLKTWMVLCCIIVHVGNKFNPQQLVCLKRKLTSFCSLDMVHNWLRSIKWNYTLSACLASAKCLIIMIIPHVSQSGVLHSYLIVIYNIFLICSILEYSNPVCSTVFLATIQQDQENSMACTRILYPELSYCQCNGTLAVTGLWCLNTRWDCIMCLKTLTTISEKSSCLYCTLR